MVRFAGVALLIMAFSLGGFYLSSCKRKRVKELREIIRLANDISVIMKYSKKPLNKIFFDVYKNGYDSLSFILDVANSSGPLYDEFSFFLERANLSLSYEEKQLLLDFVKGLGITDSNGQAEHIALYKQLFSERLNAVLPECEKQCKLSNTLGVLLGIFISIILV